MECMEKEISPLLESSSHKLFHLDRKALHLKSHLLCNHTNVQVMAEASPVPLFCHKSMGARGILAVPRDRIHWPLLLI